MATSNNPYTQDAETSGFFKRTLRQITNSWPFFKDEDINLENDAQIGQAASQQEELKVPIEPHV